MPRPDALSLSLWKSGAYRAASFDSHSGRGALVEHDGARSMRVVGVTRDGFEETVVTSRAVRGGLQRRVSTLRGYGDGRLEWNWRVVRPGLRRDETLTIDADGNTTFRQTDRRRDRTTTFHSAGDGRYEGVTTTHSGELLSTSVWERDEDGGMTGTFTGPSGEPAGEMRIPDREQRASGEPVAWSGPDSSGSIAYGADDRPKAAVKESIDGVTTYTWDDGDGHSHQVGEGPGITWLKITVPGKGEGDSSWVEFGTQSGQGASAGTTSDYTVNGVQHADGSNSWERTDVNKTTGDKEHTFGGKDADGNRSYTSSVEHADGSVTLTTRTVDKNGDGTEHVTVVDASGKVISDGTSIVKGGVTQPPGSAGGGSPLGSPGVDAPTDPGADPDQPTNPDQPNNPDNPNSPDDPNQPDTPDNPDSPDNPDNPDEPDNPDDGSDDQSEPDHPDSPDGGGDSGRDNPDGTDDTRPGIPWGKLGHRGGDFDDGFAGLRGLGAGGGDDDERTRPDRIGNLRDSLGQEIGGIVSGRGTGGGADETGWGNGGEGFRGVPLVSSNGVWHPSGADETGWGDLNDPRALVAAIGSFARASAALARSGTLASALKR